MRLLPMTLREMISRCEIISLNLFKRPVDVTSPHPRPFSQGEKGEFCKTRL